MAFVGPIAGTGSWFNLGAFHFTGTPKVSLSNVTQDGTADEDVAWGAVAFQPLSGKPANSGTLPLTVRRAQHIPTALH
ncbi:hypothetical protein AB0451_35645 [Streptomyces sp. NPDC052000]|uniref:hypothetical protein n=1 Tax=Streptomyces sp. NPDC052000 TaxID=3155676 RepID=UPI00344C5531